MVIDAGLCNLRPWSKDDIEAAAAIANDADPYTVADARAWFERQQGFGPGMQFVIEVDGQVAGGIGLERLGGDFSHAMHFGYWLGRALTEHAFANFDILRLETKVFGPNVASMRVLEKCGYIREGLLVKGVMKSGNVYDLVAYGKVRE